MSVIIGVNRNNAKEVVNRLTLRGGNTITFVESPECEFDGSIGSCLRVPAEKNPMKHIWVEPDAEKNRS